MRKIFLVLIFFIIPFFSGDSKSAENPLSSIFNKSLKIIGFDNATEKEIKDFINIKNFYLYNDGKKYELNDGKNVEYDFLPNGIFNVYDNINIIDSGTWKFSGLLNDAIELTFNNNKNLFFKFQKNFEKISVLNNLRKINDNQIDLNIDPILKADSENKRNKEKSRILAEINKKKIEEKKKKEKQLADLERARIEKVEKEKIELKRKNARELANLQSLYASNCGKSPWGKGYEKNTKEYEDCLRNLKLEDDNKKKLIEENRQEELAKIKTKKENKNQPFVVILSSKIVNDDLSAKIGIPKTMKNSNFDKLKKFELEQLVEDYSQVTLIKKTNYIVNSAPDKTENKNSEFVSGTRTKPNPAYRELQLNISKLNNYKNSLNQEYMYYQQILNKDCTYICSNPYNVAACNVCSFGKLGAIASLETIKSNFSQAEASLNDHHYRLSNTDPVVYEDVYRSYSYKVTHINGEKKTFYEVYLMKDNVIEKSLVELVENKKFKIASGIHQMEKNKGLYSSYNTLEDIKSWEAKPMKEISYKYLFDKFSLSKKDSNSKELYAALVTEEPSFFTRFFNKTNSSSKPEFERYKPKKSSKSDKRLDSIVIIKTSLGFGTGFYVSNNRIITNFHVIKDASSITVVNNDGNESTAKIIKSDIRRDLALLETNLKGKPVKFYRGEIEQGMKVDAIGHPRGLEYSLTSGVISSVRMYSSTFNITQNRNTKFIQTDVAINKGNSGGPLYHNDYVVGVNTQGLRKSENEGLNFAVHIDEVKDFLN